MKIMARHSSATAEEATPHVLETSRTNTIMNALKRREDPTIDRDDLSGGR